MTVNINDEVDFLCGPPKKYAQRSTIQHWQLRDLVLCPTVKTQFLYVNQNTVNFYDTITQTTSPAIKDLSFSPTSITSRFSILNVGGSINNALCISKHNNQTRILICNNDETIKVYSLPDLHRITSISFPTAVNYASVSPDGKKMIAVGDSSQVFLYNVTSNGDYEKVASMTGNENPNKASNDAGFSCAWNQTSEKFAVASQDGYVSVWDIRSSEKLTKIATNQNPQVKGACRCVKFSQSGSMDLLAFTEHVSYVSLVDARTFNDRQAIRVSPVGSDQHISGMAFSPDSQSLFVGVKAGRDQVLLYQMTGNLFGELELGKSYGYSKDVRAKIIRGNLVFYASGSCINVVECMNYNISETQVLHGYNIVGECPSEMHLKVVAADQPITAFAIHPKEYTIAYSERHSKCVKIVKWSQVSGVVTNIAKLEAPADLSIYLLTFSADGLYLAAVGDMPSHQINIWDWRLQKLVASKENGGPTDFLSFNPLDSKQFCTSGGNGEIRFWKIKIGFKKYVLSNIQGKKNLNPSFGSDSYQSRFNQVSWADNSISELSEDLTFKIYQHVWAPEKKVYCSDISGGILYKYSADSGNYEIVFDVERLSALYPRENFNNSILKNVAIYSKGIITGGTDGYLRYFSLKGDFIKSVKVTNGNSISALTISPDYSRLLVEVSDGKLLLHQIVNETTIMARHNNYEGINGFRVFNLEPVMISTHHNGLVYLRDVEKNTIIQSLKTNTVITAMATSLVSMIFALGSNAGVVRIYSVNSQGKEPKLIYRKKVHKNAVTKSSKLFILTSEGDSNSSGITVYDLPMKTPIPILSEDDSKIQRSAIQHWSFKIDAEGQDIFVGSRKIRTYNALCSGQQVGEKTLLSPLLDEYKDHQGEFAQFHSSFNGDFLMTLGSDGIVTMRSMIDASKCLKIFAHDNLLGGAFGGGISPDLRHVFTVGRDGLVKRWDWKYSAQGRRAAIETTETFERFISERKPQAAIIGDKAEALPEYQDKEDKVEEEIVTKVEEMYRNFISIKLKAISEKLQKLIAKNDAAPAIEKIDRSEFVIDLKERDRLTEETDKKINKLRQELEIENLKKRVLKNRIKKECWDSIEVIGQSIKSFKIDPMLSKLVEVTNYPVRRRSPAECLKIANIKRLRKVQILVDKECKLLTDQNHSNNNEQDDNMGETKLNYDPNIPNSAFLYEDAELTTKESRRIQTFILGECILDIKESFLKKFKDMCKTKQDDISKIEEKNERITAILSQLQIQEKIFHPEFDEDEVPESIMEVKDSEVTVERFLTADELKKLEAKRLKEEEWQRLQGEDNSRQRALIQMMGGKLEDRKDQEEKEEVVKPEWMNKPKEEMTEEEKKLLKEFEKKMAIFKEEQDKHRKALETELRKLQGMISDIQDAFDLKLKEFSQFKLSVDKIIYEHELKMLKQTQHAIISANDDILEEQILKRIEQLKNDKINCTNEIPEIKKELERCREDYDTAIKRDKDIDKAFKKEFHGYDFYYDTLTKLYKRRGGNFDSLEKESEDLNPFTPYEKDVIQIEMNPVSLTSADMPDGLAVDVWNKFVEIRDKKINAEQEVYNTSRYFKEMQALVQNVLEESDKIKLETEKVMTDLNQFLEYKFKSIYNIESLYAFKQGQVEVPQSPIVTNYSDGVLLHRSVVETLNEQVRSLGQLKVEALTEIKEYRKGIHALEWEIKMHDFQAEDLVIRTRDIQLLRVTKEMQEFLRSGDIHKQASEIANLEKISEHSQKVKAVLTKTHVHHLEEKANIIEKIKKKIKKKQCENIELSQRIQELNSSVLDRKKIHEVKSIIALTLVTKNIPAAQKDTHRELFTRRRLVDLAKSQAQDLAILREELERLRLRTYPAFRI
ncbi:Cilia- and flagella-associated protein 43 [Boothiomyces sp. JEL0866]|nr:Cilia- and flagella-associated protein 43 [Boothiomyces sp. JEL0866]KAJ3322410.1 Cilia- and flagella-associated protein 43 [Boothiomyces sp. JEL0866]